MFKRNLLSVLALGTFVALATGSEESETASTDWEIEMEDLDEGLAAPSAAGPAVEITSKELSSEYDKNEVAADNKYKGKTVRVTGKVAEFTEDYEGIVLEGNGPLKGVEVYFAPDAGYVYAHSVAPGEEVPIEGECAGMSNTKHYGTTANVKIIDAKFAF